VFLVGDASVPYEDIEPLDGGPRMLVEHSDQRCGFHQFLTPGPGRHTLPGNANWHDQSLTNDRAGTRWSRDDAG
jgi:hypothetical protein